MKRATSPGVVERPGAFNAVKKAVAATMVARPGAYNATVTAVQQYHRHQRWRNESERFHGMESTGGLMRWAFEACDMTRWQARVEEELREEETILDTVTIESSYLVVTDQRVLVFSASWSDDEHVRAVDRSNVVGVATGTSSDRLFLFSSLTLGAVGLLSLILGTIIDMERWIVDPATIDGEGADEFGGSGLVDFLEIVLWILFNLDDGMQLFGVLLFVCALALYAVFWIHERTPTIDLLLAGDADPISIARPVDSPELVTAVERAIERTTDRPAGTSDEDGTAGTGDEDGFVPD